MPHFCEGALITCEDFRLHQRKDGRNYIAEFIKSLKIDCDLITRAGGVQDLVRGGSKFSAPLLRDTEVSAKLHACEFVHLLNHEDCGAYESFGFSSKKEEKGQHLRDLREAKRVIEDHFPGKKIFLYFAELTDHHKGSFVIKQVQ